MKSATVRAEKGVIEVELALKNNCIISLRITGDFFIYPEDSLEEIEKGLIGVEVLEFSLKKALERIYKNHSIKTPGITIENWIAVLLKAANS